jgi:thiol-disulfide isomerase/thioredoxin
MLIDLNEDTLQDLISKNEKVVVQFSASWCGNCRIMKPKFKRLASMRLLLFLLMLKILLNQELANVSNLPTFAT